MNGKKSLLIILSLVALVVPVKWWISSDSLHSKDKNFIFIAHEKDQEDQIRGSNTVERAPKDALITVFVHGNIGLQQHLSLSNIIRFTKDDVHGTEYAKAVSIMRNDPIFCKMQAMQERGLKPIDTVCVKKGYASGAMVSLFEELNSDVHDDTNLRHYYTFGWSGITTDSARYQAAQELYEALLDLIRAYEDQVIEVKIRIIGYSHGGNVALYLGAVHEPTCRSFCVDELVLLGTPVLVETDHLIQSHLFARVYHLYSRGDRVQIMDCFSSRRFFSKKTFQSRADFEPPSKLRQIEIRVTDTIRTQRPYSASKTFISGKARFLRDRSPGHFELWCFGWTPKGYRKKFPLYPLPTVCFTPRIIAEVEEYLGRRTHDPHEKIVVDCRPAYGQMIVRKENKCEDWQVSYFANHDTLNECAEMLVKYMPQDFTVDEYQAHIKKACQQAKAWQKEYSLEC